MRKAPRSYGRGHSRRSEERRTRVAAGSSPCTAERFGLGADMSDSHGLHARSPSRVRWPRSWPSEGFGHIVLNDIAAQVGYVDGATLRTLLRERLGRGVRELRSEAR